MADLAARFADLAVSVRCVAGRALLPAAAVARVAPGDRLTLDGLRWADGAPGGGVTLLVGAHPALTSDATLTGAALTLAAPLAAPRSPAMNDPADALRDLHVEVTVELATQSFPLGEVAAWGAGPVVAFAQRLGESVALRAGGRVIARGELVDVDGQVGVRITALT
jgi:type III secretion protein Q